MKLVGLIGSIGCGKSVVSGYIIDNYNAGYYRFSDVLKDVLERIHKPVVRENLQDLGLALRNVFGDGILADILREDILADSREVIIVDGIRYPDEVEMVKALGGITCFISAPVEVRYERAVIRGTRGEGELSLSEFKQNEMRETERNIVKLGESADVIIHNDRDLDFLFSQVKEKFDLDDSLH